MSADLVLIPVPGSGDAGQPIVRVVVVPRLDSAETIAQTPMAAWPSQIAAARLAVELDGQTISGLAPQTAVDEQVWQSFFGALPVEAATAAGDGAGDGPMPTVEPTSDHADAIRATYGAAVDAPVDPAAATHPELDAAAGNELRTRWAAPAPPAPPSPAPADPGAPSPPAANPAPAPASADRDFHRILALLREHPTVLRALGLLFDLPVTGAQPAASGTVRVLWPQPPPGLPAVLSPTTAYVRHDGRGFLPASTATIQAGLVDVGDAGRWAAATFDIDGAVGRLRDAATTAAVSGEATGLPALRCAGISLLQRDRAATFANRRQARLASASGGPGGDMSPLTADDLILGLRVDVRFKGSGQWTSLCRRQTSYTVDGHQIGLPAEEEGHVKHATAVRAGDQLRADETVLRWSGWSLAVGSRRPGMPASGSGRAQPLPFTFTWDFTVPPGSLLPLRFGRDYQLRVRVADLAGAGVAAADGSTDCQTDPISYGRVEPVGSPLVQLAAGLDPASLGPGGTVEQLVVRTDADDYPRNDARVLLAPMTTLEVAEQHGDLDGDPATTLGYVQTALAQGLPDPAAEGVTVFCRPEPGGLTERTQLLGWSGTWPQAQPKRLELRTRDAGDASPAIAVDDQDPDLVIVRLGVAESVTLELSSFLSDSHFSHFALPQWRSVDQPVQVLKDGRHPMVSPRRVLSLVHAVRAPLGQPAGGLAADREPGQVSAVLTPAPPPPGSGPAASKALLGIDPASTAQLEVAASWTEVTDTTSHEVTNQPVQVLAIERGAQVLPELRHDFGDTRHRLITYSVTAVSRFRRLFNDDEDDSRFILRSDLSPVSVPSSARPPTPVVRGVYPAFRWDETQAAGVISHQRLGGRLRVELQPPWHVSGADERLAVVVTATEIARDPVWQTPETALIPDVASFADNIETAAVVTPGEGQPPVSVIPYEAFSSNGSWWADVALPAPAAQSYRPFVRLAVARYQRASLAGLELSPQVLTELVQPLPDRTLTVDTTADDGVTVTLAGLGPSGPVANRVDAIIEQSTAPDGIEVSVLDPPSDDSPGWQALVTSEGQLGNPMVLDRPSGPARLRLRVREVECPQPGVEGGPEGSGTELTERVIFTDVVPL